MSKTLIALGVTGGIAAYKSAQLCSDLVKAGFEVQVIMTENAVKFVTPLTFRTLSRNPVITSLWELPQWQPEHVALAQSAELFITAPATVNFIAKYANGIADDALSTFAATFNGKAAIAPAMNPNMWRHWTCQENIEKLASHGIRIIGPAAGRVACGDDGIGRMSEVTEILAVIKEMLEES
jgi:phosphopantothenoylcysteine decarboxylase/phosphopantothenate--cysteine ligase